MEVGGICWYRVLPGFAGTDPISLAKAVVQVCDLLDDLALDRPVLDRLGSGRRGRLAPDSSEPERSARWSCVDAPLGHLELLPGRALAAANRPPILLAATDPSGGPILDQQQRVLSGAGAAPTIWCRVEGSPDDQDKAVAERIGRWLEDG